MANFKQGTMGASVIHKGKERDRQNTIGFDRSKNDELNKLYTDALNYNAYVVAWQMFNDDTPQPKKADDRYNKRF